ncbi:MAG: hypothetical protein ACXAE3_09200 [Candidatus Kariarchaeaceae archaeon]|jgi:hypothetical protein
MESPVISTYSHPIVDRDGPSTVYLTLVEYSNAIQAALYDKEPKLGSMVLSYKAGELVQSQTVFQGKHLELARLLGMLLSKRKDAIIYASVNISEDARVTHETIRMLLEHMDSKS